MILSNANADPKYLQQYKIRILFCAHFELFSQEQSWVHAYEDTVDEWWSVYPGTVQQTFQQHRGDGQLLHHQQVAHQGGGACQLEDASV